MKPVLLTQKFARKTLTRNAVSQPLTSVNNPTCNPSYPVVFYQPVHDWNKEMNVRKRAEDRTI